MLLDVCTFAQYGRSVPKHKQKIYDTIVLLKPFQVYVSVYKYQHLAGLEIGSIVFTGVIIVPYHPIVTWDLTHSPKMHNNH